MLPPEPVLLVFNLDESWDAGAQEEVLRETRRLATALEGEGHRPGDSRRGEKIFIPCEPGPGRGIVFITGARLSRGSNGARPRRPGVGGAGFV
jgi:hypothetical protein